MKTTNHIVQNTADYLKELERANVPKETAAKLTLLHFFVLKAKQEGYLD